jgi:hypothetical protein
MTDDGGVVTVAHISFRQWLFRGEFPPPVREGLRALPGKERFVLVREARRRVDRGWRRYATLIACVPTLGLAMLLLSWKLSLWIVLLIMLLPLVVLQMWHEFRMHKAVCRELAKRFPGRCSGCGYDLQLIEEPGCPECGAGRDEFVMP